MPTNAQVREALQGSIAKWEAIVAGTGVDGGYRDCPLCKVFYRRPDQCFGCPVTVHTGEHNCVESPYARWLNYRTFEAGQERKPSDLGDFKLAQAELDFLRMLDQKFFVDGVITDGEDYIVSARAGSAG